VTLHILSVSPRAGDAFAQCLRVLAPGDALLLTGDGVLAAWPGTPAAQALAARGAALGVYALDADSAQRGLVELAPGVERIDDAGFVALACAQARSLSWF